MPDHIMISEIFGPTLQGEGMMAGKLSHFIRTFGCSYRCSWCDSMFSVDPNHSADAHRLTEDDIIERIQRLPMAPWVTLTGGDPVDWDLTKTVIMLAPEYKVAVETQGAVWRDWLEYCHLVTVSPKGPSSGMGDRYDPAVLNKYYVRMHGRMVLKIACFTEDDLDFADRMSRFIPDVPLYLSAGTPVGGNAAVVISRYQWLTGAVLQRRLDRLVHATVLPQLHVLLWGQDRGH